MNAETQTVNQTGRGQRIDKVGDVLRSGSPESLQHYLYLLAEYEPGLVRHVFAVAAFARELARRTGLSPIHTDIIWLAGLLHDLGKLFVPRTILHKNGPLTMVEREQVQKHSESGWKVLSPLSWAGEVAPLVRSHHERWDGSGYPDGLAGEAIPIGARILSVADALDAMTTERVYRKGLSFAAARQEITAMSGSQFDPEIVRIALTVTDQEWIALRDESMAVGISPSYPIAG